METKRIIDFWGINLANIIFGISGLIIIFVDTHSFWAMVGGVIAGIHLQFTVKK